jgi:hypothetical protein
VTVRRSELALACLCQLLFRLALRTVRFKTFLRLARLRLPAARDPLPLRDLERLAQRSTRVCRGSCLTESVVMKLLAARHGHPVPLLTIGVVREPGTLRAHAWTALERAAGFAPLWREPSERKEDAWRA